jgi:hypothetical protein
MRAGERAPDDAAPLTSADLLLHPVRLRIVKAFLGDRKLTTSQLSGELSDVPVGSLYRHVSLLAHAGVLQVVAERRVRGAVERTYALRQAAAQMQPDEVAAMSRDEHTQAFIAFVAGLLSDFDQYVGSDTFNPTRDIAGYRMAGMWLTDAEYEEFLHDLMAIALPRVAHAPRRGRRRRLFYQVLLPAPGVPAASQRSAGTSKSRRQRMQKS